MSERNAGVTADPVFLGVTRPPMRFGVTYMALIFNAVFTMEVFILTKNLLVLLIAMPIHGVCMLLCARDARYFDLLLRLGQDPPGGLLLHHPVLEGRELQPPRRSTCRISPAGARRPSRCASR